jgi:5-methylcytosine-specific restriction endonuclease McrA
MTEKQTRPISTGRSKDARVARKERARLHASTDGRCFYCGLPVRLEDESPTRDWILLDRHDRMVTEHKNPLSRGGPRTRDNAVPSCECCNSRKGALTADEFRFQRGLRAGSLSFSFACEPERHQRDWLCVHSRSFEQSLIRHNSPDAR